MKIWIPKTVDLYENGVLFQRTIQRTENGPIEIVYPSKDEDGYCTSCDKGSCTATPGCLAISNPPHQDGEDIQIDEWCELTDRQKLVLIRHAPKWTVLELIEEVEQMLKGNNK